MKRPFVPIGLRRLAVVALWLGVPAIASAAQVEGRVVDVDGAGVVLSLVLEVHDGQQIVYQGEGRTDSDGVARWPDVPRSEGLNARIRTTYDGAEYFSEVAALDNGAGSFALTVRPVVREGRPLHLDILHLIVQADEPGFLRVLQFMTVSNAGEAPFAGGPRLADGRSAGVVIPLPAAATKVSAAPFPNADDALNLDRAQTDSDRILDGRPVPADGRQVAVTYELTLEDGGADIALLLPYPTQNVSLLLGGAGAKELTIESEQLRFENTEMIGDQEYGLWVVEALQPGTELAFTVAPPGLTLTPGQIGLLAAGAGLLLAVAGSLLGGGSADYRAEQRRTVIAAIAAIDDSHQAGDVDDSDYFRRRGHELDRLALLDLGEGV